MRILMTGHKGFIGSHLYPYLWDRGYTMYGIDLKDGKDILTCTLDYEVDVVIHLAGKSGVRESMRLPGPYWHVNVEGSRRIFDQFGEARILYASSSSAYEPTLNPYAASKYIMDMMAPDSSVGMRFHTVYSDNPRKGMLLEKLLSNSVEYITDHSRDFIHVEDLCDAIELLIKNPNINGVVDIGTGKSTNVQDLAPGKPLRLNRVHERKCTQANIEILKELGFEPKYNVKEFLTNKGVDIKL
jgi:dTDP-glucose 4,6-dehydratase/UDP-glucose 4-epimerase